MTGQRVPVVITGLAATSAFGRDAGALLAAALAGTPGFAPVRRFDVTGRRVDVAATLPGSPDLRTELVATVDEACAGADLTSTQRRDIPLLLAVHADPHLAGHATGEFGVPAEFVGRAAVAESAAAEFVGRTAEAADSEVRDSRPPSAAGFADEVANRCGLAGGARAYTSACVAATTAVADAAAMVSLGHTSRVVVAAGYLVESNQFALFDAGRAMARDGQVRPFSAHRSGLLLGDGVAAVVVESAPAARQRGAEALARLDGWGRAGDAYHVCQPRPDGAGLAHAIAAALGRAGLRGDQIGYVNAHGSGTLFSDAAEACALRLALAGHADRVPVSSTKSVHGQALEASGLLELIITVLALRAGQLPVNAGFLGPDVACPLDVIVDRPRTASPAHALSLNSAFGGANTALVVGTP